MIIYIIKNYINTKVYIGQTTYNDIEKRIQTYKKEYLRENRTRPIISAMRKYGFENFYFEIIEKDIQTKEELDIKEKFYIKKFKSLCSQNGYNIELGGNGPGKHSEETKRKISESQKGEKNHMFQKSGKENAMSKPIIELTTGLTFESANLAAQYFKINFSHVCAVARGERGSTNSLIFRYLNNEGVPILNEDRIRPKDKTLYKKIPEQYQKYL